MNSFRKYSPLILSLLLVFILGCKKEKIDYVDFVELKSNDNQWTIEWKDSSLEKGNIKLVNQKWLMYFLHWTPLNEDNNEISVEYVKNKMLTLWGPSMPFKIKNTGGATYVNQHKAYFVDGTIFNDKVKTRFIIWNCPESNRQFISDCNINLKVGTPISLHDLQINDITNSVKCHHIDTTTINPLIPQTIENNDLEIEFSIPDNWKAQEFIYDTNYMEYAIPGFYPEGISKEKGSYLSVLNDSEKIIQLLWNNNKQSISQDLMKSFIEELKKDTISELLDTLILKTYTTDFEIKSNEIENNVLKANGYYLLESSIKKYNYKESTKYIYNIYMWKNKKTNFFLITSIVAYDNMLGVPFDLKPGKEIMDSFFINEVAPIIKTINF